MNHMTKETIITEVAQELLLNEGLGTHWIELKYNLNRHEANGILQSARADLKNYPTRFRPEDLLWEQTTIVPPQHKFTPENLYAGYVDTEGETVGGTCF